MDRFGFGWFVLLFPAIAVAGLLAQGGVPGMAPPGGTAQATLYAFETAALRSDRAAVAAVCAPGVEEDALLVAQLLERDGRAVGWTYGWRKSGSATIEDAEAWGKEVSGRLLLLELEPGTWRIVRAFVE